MVSLLFEETIKRNLNIWGYIEESNMTPKDKNHQAVVILKYVSPELVDSLKNLDNFIEFLESNLDTSYIPNCNNVFNNLEVLGIKFKSISATNELILEKLADLNAYKISLENLKTVLQVNEVLRETLKNNSKVEEYCLSNIQIFIFEVLMKQENYNEKEDIFIEFIMYLYEFEKEEIEGFDLMIESLIKNWNGTISELKKIKLINLIDNFYRLNKFTLSWSNVDYFINEFKSNDLEFEIEYILSDEEKWTEFVNNSSFETQKEFYESKKYMQFVEIILILDSSDHPELQNFIDQLMFSMSIKNIHEIDYQVFVWLINNELLNWDRNIYNQLNDQHKLKYIIDKIQYVENDLVDLINENELIWSLEIFTKLIEEETVDLVMLQNYIEQNILEIKIEEIKFLYNDNKLSFNGNLINKIENKDIKIEHLVHLTSEGMNDEIIAYFEDQVVPWNKMLFERLKEKSLSNSAKYLSDNLNEIKNVVIDQKLFEGMLKHLNDVNDIFKVLEHNTSLEITNYVAMVMLNYFKNDKESVLELIKDDLMISIINSLPIEDSSILLLEFIKFRKDSRAKVFSFVQKLSKPFSFIEKNGKQFKIDSTHHNIHELLQYLESIKVISSKEELSNSQMYLVRNKRS